jgi:hypothetical protein
MTHRAGLVALALVQLLPATGEGASTRRHAQVSLDVTRRASAHGCPSEKELRREVTAILGYAPFDGSARRRVTSVLWASGGMFHARIELQDARTHKSLGVRELSAGGPTCAELGPAMALAIALAIDPLAQPPPPRAVAAIPRPAPAVTPAPAPRLATVGVGQTASLSAAAASTPGASIQPAVAPVETTQPPSAPPAPPDAGTLVLAAAVAPADGGTDAGLLSAAPTPLDAGVPPVAVALAPEVSKAEPAEPAAAAPAPSQKEDARAWHALAGVGADWTLGLVPSAAFGVVAHGGVAFRFASVELEASWLPSTSIAFASGTISSTLVTGALVGCATFGDFGACGLFQAGPLTSQGKGYADAQSHTTWVVALGARGQWDWVFAHPVGLRLQVDGLVNLVRTRLLVGPDTAWRAPGVALAVGAGVFLVF